MSYILPQWPWECQYGKAFLDFLLYLMPHWPGLGKADENGNMDQDWVGQNMLKNQIKIQSEIVVIFPLPQV